MDWASVLTLVKNLVEMHDGTVTARSAGLGHGTEFEVRLPITSIAAPPQPSITNTSPGLGLRILVVDDNRDSATSMAKLLDMTGYQTQTAFDGFDGLDAAEKFRPDIVLLDIGLPKLNGYEVARKIRQQPWGQKLLLVALTGWGQEEDRRKSSESGFDAHMVKPVEYKALMKFLAESARQRQSPA